MISDTSSAALIAVINSRIQTGLLESEDNSCLCGSFDERLVGQSDWLGLNARTVICRSCGLLRLNPRLSEQGYNEFYSSDEYRRLHSGEDFEADAEQRFAERQGEHIRWLAEPHFDPGNLIRVLELGCGGGWNLANFSDARFEARGYDLSPGLVEFGRKKGLDLQIGAIEDAAQDYSWADLIVLNHVLEHLRDPLGTLRTLRTKAKVGSLLYIGVPNIDHFNLGELQLAHTFYFSPRTLKYYLQRAGWQLTEFGTAQGVHMHALCKAGEPFDQSELLSGEYERMRRIIRAARIRRAVVQGLERLGVKDLVRAFARWTFRRQQWPRQAPSSTPPR